ncbi:MAG: branched-chain amino acid transaminase [Anaerolineales bacterium]|nr:branched-chain amino acid transaminase [Anaerolineales bacterium]
MTSPIHAYFKGQIVPYSEARVGVMTHALNYGTAVFGGLRAYWNEAEEQLYLFRPQDHYTRLLESAKLMCMEIGLTPQELTRITTNLARADGYRMDIYIRPMIYKSDETIGVKLHDLTDELTIFSVPFDKYVSNDTDAHVTFSSWRRIDDNMIPARGKISGAYVNSALIKTDALRAGFDEALVLTEDGHVSEGSAENIFMMRGGRLVTPPVTENILEGITRRTIINLVQDELGVEVVERPIDRTEVYLCEEFFMTGTAAQVTAITRVDHRTIGEGSMGPITSRLRDLFGDIVRGRVAKYGHWNTAIYSTESEAVAS